MKKNNGYLIIGNILNGFEMIIYILVLLLFLMFSNKHLLDISFNGMYASSGGKFFFIPDFINSIFSFCLLMGIYATIKFVFGLIGYCKNKASLLFISLTINIMVCFLFVSSLSIFIVYELVTLVIMLIGFYKFKKDNLINDSHNMVEL